MGIVDETITIKIRAGEDVTENAGNDRSRLGWGDLAFALAATALLLWTAASRGPWLDEFWTMWLTDPQQSWGVSVDRWVSDQHPALFSLFVHATRSLIGGSIELQRCIVNGIGLAAFFAATATFIRQTPRHAGFFRIFAMLVLTLPTLAEEFADLRSYFLQMMACAIWLAFVVHAEARDRALSRLAVAFGCAAAFFMIATHFVGGVEGFLFCAGGVLILYRHPHRRRELAWVVAAAGLGCVVLLASAGVQVPHWARELDFRWVNSNLMDAIGMYWTIAFAVLWCGFPIIAAGLAGALRPSSPMLRYQIVIVVAAVIAMAAILALNQLQPIAVPRYLVPLSIAFSAIVAAGATALWPESRSFRAVVMLWALGCGWYSTSRAADDHGWHLGAAELARLIAACPSTRVVAVSGWVFGPEAGTRTAWREEPVFALGYRTAAARYGFTPEIVSLPSRRPVLSVKVGACPTVLWAEHTLWSPPEGQEFTMAGLRTPPGTVTERDTKTWGDILVIAHAPSKP